MPGPSSRAQIERFIADLRLLLAVSSLFAIWLDPAEPARSAGLTYGAHWVFVTYCAILVVVTRRHSFQPRAILAMHAIDIGAFSMFQFLTLGPSSPFFLYFVFSMFCGALRWGWRGTLTTSIAVGSAYLIITLWMVRTLGPNEFDLTRFITRIVYLVSASGMLVYLGRHEERLRSEIERLAHWPTPTGIPEQRAIELMLAHAARIVGADRAAVAWEAGDEPVIHVGVWTPAGLTLTEYAPDAAPALPVIHLDVNRLSLPANLRAVVDSAGPVTAAFHTDQVSGRAFFAGLGPPPAEVTPLTEVVAREIGATLAQIHSAHQTHELAAREERLRLARDLHDGVLQSLTAIRLELNAIGQAVHANDPSAPGRLMGLERALSIEQRELRLFIDGLKPDGAVATPPGTLAERLSALRERIALEWKTPVAIRVSAAAPGSHPRLTEAVPLMVHEAVTNALKHAQPSSVTVTVDGDATTLRIVVADDGHGFGFKGRYDHRALETAAVAPRSLFERVSALGGTMSIESSAAGSRIEMILSA